MDSGTGSSVAVAQVYPSEQSVGRILGLGPVPALSLLAQPTFEQPVPRIQRTVPAPLPELAEAA